MLVEFFVAGGFAMVPTLVFGFLLVTAATLYALRREARMARLSLHLGFLTTATGLLGTFTGLCVTFRYVVSVDPVQQLGILALGMEESLHNIILALLLVVLAVALTAVGQLRTTERASQEPQHRGIG